MVNPQLEEGQIVLCTVDKILGTTVFVKIEDNVEGTLTTSEIAPGRIRNLRDYVSPGKRIVCKILSIKGDRIFLSLRRVKQNEKKELLDKLQKETNYKAILRTVLGKENLDEKINEITQDQTLFDFFEKSKQEPNILDKYFNKETKEKIVKILDSKKEKEKEIKQIFRLSNKSPNGILVIKKIIQEAIKNSGAEINYLAAGRYRISIKGEDFKEIKTKLNPIFDIIESRAKKENCEFSIEKS